VCPDAACLSINASAASRGAPQGYGWARSPLTGLVGRRSENPGLAARFARGCARGYKRPPLPGLVSGRPSPPALRDAGVNRCQAQAALALLVLRLPRGRAEQLARGTDGIQSVDRAAEVHRDPRAPARTVELTPGP